MCVIERRCVFFTKQRGLYVPFKHTSLDLSTIFPKVNKLIGIDRACILITPSLKKEKKPTPL